MGDIKKVDPLFTLTSCSLVLDGSSADLLLGDSIGDNVIGMTCLLSDAVLSLLFIENKAGIGMVEPVARLGSGVLAASAFSASSNLPGETTIGITTTDESPWFLLVELSLGAELIGLFERGIPKGTGVELAGWVNSSLKLLREFCEKDEPTSVEPIFGRLGNGALEEGNAGNAGLKEGMGPKSGMRDSKFVGTGGIAFEGCGIGDIELDCSAPEVGV